MMFWGGSLGDKVFSAVSRVIHHVLKKHRTKRKQSAIYLHVIKRFLFSRTQMESVSHYLESLAYQDEIVKEDGFSKGCFFVIRKQKNREASAQLPGKKTSFCQP